MNIKDNIFALISLLLVLSGMVFKAIALVAIAMGILYLIGYFFPYVIAELGFPCNTVYSCIEMVF